MKKWFLKFLRFGLCVDEYCARVSGNHEFRADSVRRIAEIDRELDLLSLEGRG
jgi:hypothetical protein